MEDREAVERSRNPWPVVIVGGLAVFGAISLVQFLLGLAFTLGKLLIVAGIVALGVVFFRGPPDRGRS
jgi:hypothetical protein